MSDRETVVMVRREEGGGTKKETRHQPQLHHFILSLFGPLQFGLKAASSNKRRHFEELQTSSVHRVSTRKPVFLSSNQPAQVDLMGSETMFSPDASQLLRRLAFLSFSNVKSELPFFPLYFLVWPPSPTCTVLTMTPSVLEVTQSCETVELNLCPRFTPRLWNFYG